MSIILIIIDMFMSVCATEIMVTMGYTRRDIEESLSENKYDSLTATYLLLGRPSLDVSPTAFPANSLSAASFSCLCMLRRISKWVIAGGVSVVGLLVCAFMSLSSLSSVIISAAPTTRGIKH